MKFMLLVYNDPALLEAEIARVSAHRSKAAAHRPAADALFGKGGG